MDSIKVTLYRFANGDTYEGEVRAGVVAGRGTSVTKSGDRIEGSFADGKPNGTGIYRFASGDRYEGEMVFGKLQGKGRYFSANGDRIEAQFTDGKPQGKGVYFFSNGDRYEGDLQGGAPAAPGHISTRAARSTREVVNGRPQGKGTFWFPDGARFEGVFENGLAKASGEMVKPDGVRGHYHQRLKQKTSDTSSSPPAALPAGIANVGLLQTESFHLPLSV